MSSNLVELNVNPCKMCMPLGTATAFYGIKECISILHGSQGCATYIRRHMATHYNEPVDIASSSLTEQGTIFGGESNLIKGIENLIELYHPSVIAVATTCLAETIGEDVPSIINRFFDTHPDADVKIINVASAGYGGTQYEGYFSALRAIVSQVEMETESNEYINIITPVLSPADTRYLKSLLDDMGVNYILLPDLSENLDGVHEVPYNRLKNGGTSLEEIRKMAGAKATIELSLFCDSAHSPGKYLFDTYNVPIYKMAMPAGIRDTDAFIDKIEELGGKKNDKITLERGRYIDAMIDSHKYSAEGRASIFGEPDFVYSMTRLCCENGIVPVVAATGSVCDNFKMLIAGEIENCAKQMFVDNVFVKDDCDFDTIETYSVDNRANIMLGSSDGRRIAHKHNIELIRLAFPIHDRVGGQRIRFLGYEGSLSVLDSIANHMLRTTEENFRDELYDKYFKEGDQMNKSAEIPSIEEKTAAHPCFNCGAGKNARIHLPVAPKCNIQCNYCVRKFDCPNESRPGVTTQILSPDEAYKKYAYVKEKVDNLSVVGIAGPGDALANFDETKKTLELIQEYDPNVTFCLSTNGLMLPLYADELIKLGISHLTVTINSVDPEIGAKIYRHIDYMGIRYIGKIGAAILMTNQLSGLKMMADKGIVCKVNIVVLKDINENHIETVVKKVKELGATITNIMQMIPVAGSAFESMGQVSNKEITQIRKNCEVHLKQMYHCRQCRADAIGTLDNDLSIEYRNCAGSCSSPNTAHKVKIKLAVASKSGMIVDCHFGHTNEFYIYESDGESIKFIERRLVDKYCSGVECEDPDNKIEKIVKTISDCSGVLALRIGDAPTKKLKENGISVITTYEKIEIAVADAAKKLA